VDGLFGLDWVETDLVGRERGPRNRNALMSEEAVGDGGGKLLFGHPEFAQRF
jgi:hypothetical protein